MNVPDAAIFERLHWLVNTPGLGGLVTLLIIGTLGTIYLGAIIWIVRGGQSNEQDIYSYPTSTLLNNHSHDSDK